MNVFLSRHRDIASRKIQKPNEHSRGSWWREVIMRKMGPAMVGLDNSLSGTVPMTYWKLQCQAKQTPSFKIPPKRKKGERENQHPSLSSSSSPPSFFFSPTPPSLISPSSSRAAIPPNQSSGFCYNPTREPMSEFSGVLDIYVHHARNIHNICIYDNQDVYAKFSLTYSPDETLSTRIVNGGGKNPEFNENLQMKITHLDSVLKCEIWMLSRARNYLEDQLLGFALVPLSSVVGKGKITQDFTLSSTDLFHSPAGTVQLTLFFHTSTLPVDPSAKPFIDSSNLTPMRAPSSIASEVVLLDRKPDVIDPVEYGRIEFPDIDVARENQQMVSEYFDMAKRSRPNFTTAPFLHLGASSSLQPNDDYDMTVTSGEENGGGSSSPNDSSVLDHENSYQNSGVFSSTTTSLSDDRNSIESAIEKKSESSNSRVVSISDAYQSPGASPDTPTSKNESAVSGVSKESNHHPCSCKEEEKNGKSMGSVELGSVFTSPLVNINLEPEQTAMQQQIVDMYMRSMQQFTESLAKMKLPMDLDKPGSDDRGDVIQSQNNNLDSEKKKKDGSRVFYGSRAFF